jgi:hypothetical protein
MSRRWWGLTVFDQVVGFANKAPEHACAPQKYFALTGKTLNYQDWMLDV